MALHGSLKEFNLIEIFQLISLGRKSGALVIEKDSQQVKFFFQEGKIVLSLTSKRPFPSNALVNLGLLSKEESEEVNTKPEEVLPMFLEKALTTKENMDQKKMAQFFHQHLLDNLLEISPWHEGIFSFETKRIWKKDPSISYPVAEIVSQAEKCLHEWEEIKKELPAKGVSLCLSLSAADKDGEITITPAEWRVIYSLGSAKTLDQLREEVPLTIFSLGKILTALLKKRLIEEKLNEDKSSKNDVKVEISRHLGGKKIRKQTIEIRDISGKYVVPTG